MKNNVTMLALLLMGGSLILAGCNNTTSEVDLEIEATPESEMVEINEEVLYNADSWKEVIPEDCTYFFDGCNNCSRIEGEEGAVCTKMFCEKYGEPRCTDDERQLSDEEWSEENGEVLDGTENDTIMLDVE